MHTKSNCGLQFFELDELGNEAYEYQKAKIQKESLECEASEVEALPIRRFGLRRFHFFPGNKRNIRLQGPFTLLVDLALLDFLVQDVFPSGAVLGQDGRLFFVWLMGSETSFEKGNGTWQDRGFREND